MSALATTEDYEARHGEVSESDAELIETLLDDASALVLLEAQMDDDWEPSGEAVPNAVIAIVVGMAYRAWKNPSGISSESLGSASVTYSAASDGVWMTGRERRIIARLAGLGTFRSVTLTSPYSGDTTSDLDFYPDDL